MNNDKMPSEKANNLVTNWFVRNGLGIYTSFTISDFYSLMIEIDAALCEAEQNYTDLVWLLRKRFPQRPDGTLPDFKIEDVLLENEELRKNLSKPPTPIDPVDIFQRADGSVYIFLPNRDSGIEYGIDYVDVDRLIRSGKELLRNAQAKYAEEHDEPGLEPKEATEV